MLDPIQREFKCLIQVASQTPPEEDAEEQTDTTDLLGATKKERKLPANIKEEDEENYKESRYLNQIIYLSAFLFFIQ